MLTVRSKFRKRLNKYGLFGKFARKKPLLAQLSIVALVQITRLWEQYPSDRQGHSGDVWP